MDEKLATGSFGEVFDLAKDEEIKIDNNGRQIGRSRLQNDDEPCIAFGFNSSETDDDLEFDTAIMRAGRSSSSF